MTCIDFSGPIGSTTPNTGAFTTLSVSGLITSTKTGQLFAATSATTQAAYFQLGNTGGQNYIGIDDSTGATLASGNAYDMVAYGNTGLSLVIGGNKVMRLTSTTVTANFPLSVTGTLSTTGNVGIGTASNATTTLRLAGSQSGSGARSYNDATTVTATANSDQLFGNVHSGGTVATGTFTGLTYFGTYLNTMSVTGTGTIATAYQLYIAAAPTATTKYGIYQAGTDANYFGGLIQAASIQNTPIGSTTPNTGAFTSLSGTANGPGLGAGINAMNVQSIGTSGFVGYGLKRTGDTNGGWLMGTGAVVEGDWGLYQNQGGAAVPVQRLYLNASGGPFTANTGISTTTLTTSAAITASYSNPYIIINRQATTEYSTLAFRTNGATTGGWEIYGTNAANQNLNFYSYQAAATVAALASTGLYITGVISATGNVTLSSASASPYLTINDGQAIGGNARSIYFTNTGAGSKYNWLIGAQILNDNTFQIIPSTAAGGSTYSTAVATFSTTGLSVTGTLSTTGNVGVLSGANAGISLTVGGNQSGDGGVGIAHYSTFTATAINQTFNNDLSLPTIATGTYTGLTFFNSRLGTPTVTGTGTIATAYQLYIAAAPTATTKYGIYQAGSDPNVLSGALTVGGPITSTVGSTTSVLTASGGTTIVGNTAAGSTQIYASNAVAATFSTTGLVVSGQIEATTLGTGTSAQLKLTRTGVGSRYIQVGGSKEIIFASSAGANGFTIDDSSNLSGIGTLSTTGNVGIGTAAISQQALRIVQSFSTSAGSGWGIVLAPTVSATANSDNIGQAFFDGNTIATGTYTGLTYYGTRIGNPTVTGTGTIATAYQLYIAAAPTATTKYGIYQAGTDTNVLNGPIYFNGTPTAQTSSGTAAVYAFNQSGVQSGTIGLRATTGGYDFSLGGSSYMYLNTTGLTVTGVLGLGSASPNSALGINLTMGTGKTPAQFTVNGNTWQFGANVGTAGDADFGFYSYPATATILKLTSSGATLTGSLAAVPTASANAVQGSGGAYVTVVALPSGWGTVHVVATENGTTNVGYYQVDYVNGTGIAIQAKTGTTAGATTGQLTFQLSGSNLQARGVNATAPSAVKYWIVGGSF